MSAHFAGSEFTPTANLHARARLRSGRSTRLAGSTNAFSAPLPTYRTYREHPDGAVLGIRYGHLNSYDQEARNQQVAYRLNSSDVVNDTIDGEVLAIRSDTGAYYSMQGTSATAWCALISGGDLDVIAQAVADHHAVDTETARAALETFGAELVAESLLLDGPADADAMVELPRETKGTPWEAPRFEKYTDMQDLLLFDPIHEVEPSGWPEVTVDNK